MFYAGRALLMLYTILVTDAPPMFYVSEIGWLSSYLFLYLLQYSISDKEERAFRCSRMYVAAAVIVFFHIVLYQHRKLDL